jgi:hypothetical protein
MTMVKFVKLSKTVVVSLDGKSYTIPNSHPLYEKVCEAIDRNELEELSAVLNHAEIQSFLGKLSLKPR